MAMSVGPSGDDDEFGLNSTINTTPLVDIMLVLLIIFLITVPVVLQAVPVELPKERNIPTQTKPENVNLAVDVDGQVYWNLTPVTEDELLQRLLEVAVMKPQPEVHIRGDAKTRYENVGKVVFACQQAAIQKVGFITDPPSGIMVTR